MRIIGIDPGYGILGFGIIDYQNNKHTLVDYGVIKTSKDISFPDRLLHIGKRLNELLEIYNPKEMAVEELFFQKNAKTAMFVAQARGVILYVAKEKNIPVYEYTPLQIKQGLTGYGRAEKIQIQQMVKLFLNLTKIPKPDDAADALAVAITHSNTKVYR
ncbi:MAG: crossover junction endodeoxyribonuclease RuvC [Christensenellales bacterium]|jgi:crossover junction endodeoxyribonuclease RuvC|nr:crossover junction endodeoxyribonuclease RuvC [Clostridiales bacterium]